MTEPPAATPGYGPTAPGYGPTAPGYGWSGPVGAPGAGAAHWADGFLPAPEYSSPGGQRLAGPADRLLARVIDGLILLVPTLAVDIPLVIVAFVMLKPIAQAPRIDGGDLLTAFVIIMAVVFVASTLSAAISYLYEVAYMARTGQTLGKRAMRIRVVRVEDGGPIAPSHARRRWLANEGVALLGIIPLVGTITSVYSWLNSLWLLWDKPHRQCLHDKYARTAVVKLGAADAA